MTINEIDTKNGSLTLNNCTVSKLNAGGRQTTTVATLNNTTVTNLNLWGHTSLTGGSKVTGTTTVKNVNTGSDQPKVTVASGSSIAGVTLEKIETGTDKAITADTYTLFDGEGTYPETITFGKDATGKGYDYIGGVLTKAVDSTDYKTSDGTITNTGSQSDLTEGDQYWTFTAKEANAKDTAVVFKNGEGKETTVNVSFGDTTFSGTGGIVFSIIAVGSKDMTGLQAKLTTQTVD